MTFSIINSTDIDKINDTLFITSNETRWFDVLQNSVIFQIQIYAIPFLVVFGVVGNALSLWLFCTPGFRGHSSSCYLAALAASDTLFLLNLFVVWASNLLVNLFNRNGWCQAVTYLTHVSTFMSVWLVVAFTVERFIAVCYPLLRSLVCTVKRARGIVCGLAVIAVVLYSYLLLAAGVEQITTDGEFQCTLREGYGNIASIMNAVDTVLTLVIPVIAILTLNTRIAKCVYYVDSLNREQADGEVPIGRRFISQRRKEKTSEREGGIGGGMGRIGEGNTISCGVGKSTRKSQHGVTKMLLVISTIFILLNLPTYVMRIYMYIKSFSGKEMGPPSLTLYTLEQTFTLLFYSNFAVNFLLYCATGQNFRRAVMAMCSKGSNRQYLPYSRQASSSHYRKQTPASPESSRVGRVSHTSRHTTATTVLLADYPDNTTHFNSPRKSCSVRSTSTVTTTLLVGNYESDTTIQQSFNDYAENTRGKPTRKLIEPMTFEN